MVRGMLKDKVDTISSEQLRTIEKESDLVLLDARSKEEWKVSHLPGAKHIGYEPINKNVVDNISKDTPIVVYCSIGKRSEEVAHEIKEMGYENVQNLFGGIFDWTNRGYKVINPEGQNVRRVHPYNAIWGIWVNNYEKVDGSE